MFLLAQKLMGLLVVDGGLLVDGRRVKNPQRVAYWWGLHIFLGGGEFITCMFPHNINILTQFAATVVSIIVCWGICSPHSHEGAVPPPASSPSRLPLALATLLTEDPSFGPWLLKGLWAPGLICTIEVHIHVLVPSGYDNVEMGMPFFFRTEQMSKGMSSP